MRVLIIGAAPIGKKEKLSKIIKDIDYVICADGGFNNAKRLGIRPDLVMGDMDSIKGILPKKINFIKFPVEKDDTDMMLCVKKALEMGAEEVVIIGGIGGDRIDHTIANICILKFLDEINISHRLIGDTQELLVLGEEKSLKIKNLEGHTISVFPVGHNLCKVWYDGLYYKMSGDNIYINNPVGISNRVISRNSTVEILKGSALVIISK